MPTAPPAGLHRRAAALAAAAGPHRVQLSRAADWRIPANTVSVARPTCWGNPFRVGALGVADQVKAVELFRRMLGRADLAADHRLFVFTPERLQVTLGGKNLACWCRLDQPCHADELLRVANRTA